MSPRSGVPRFPWPILIAFYAARLSDDGVILTSMPGYPKAQHSVACASERNISRQRQWRTWRI